MKIPKIDLSKYCESERIDSTIEQIILQGLIVFDCNIQKTKKQFNIEDDTVEKIFLKYYTQLNRIMNSQENNTDVDSSIANIISLYHDHISEITKIVDNNPNTKLLSDRVIKNLNSISDRLIEIKEQNSKAYETTINRLSDQIIKLKTLEKVEHGEIEDNSDYDDNVQTVADKLMEHNNFETYTRTKKCKVIDTKTGKEVSFDSQVECAKFLHTSKAYTNVCIKTHSMYKKRYYIIEDE